MAQLTGGGQIDPKQKFPFVGRPTVTGLGRKVSTAQ